MSRSLRYSQIFQGKNSGKIPPIDFNRSEISDIVYNGLPADSLASMATEPFVSTYLPIMYPQALVGS